jgi:glutaminyl-tRNA synthetase
MQAKMSGGHCYLRFDDTNPIKENQEFIDNIEENIRWMGYNPWKITHASDNFQQLYEFAVKLIRDGNAFVCNETK